MNPRLSFVTRHVIQTAMPDGALVEYRRYNRRPDVRSVHAAVVGLSRPWELVAVRIPAHALRDAAAVESGSEVNATGFAML